GEAQRQPREKGEEGPLALAPEDERERNEEEEHLAGVGEERPAVLQGRAEPQVEERREEGHVHSARAGVGEVGEESRREEGEDDAREPQAREREASRE